MFSFQIIYKTLTFFIALGIIWSVVQLVVMLIFILGKLGHTGITVHEFARSWTTVWVQRVVWICVIIRWVIRRTIVSIIITTIIRCNIIITVVIVVIVVIIVIIRCFVTGWSVICCTVIRCFVTGWRVIGCIVIGCRIIYVILITVLVCISVRNISLIIVCLNLS